MEYKEIVLGTVIVRYYYMPAAAGYGARLYVNKSHYTKDMIKFFDMLCVWGSADKETEEYISWEFPISEVLPESFFVRMLSKLA